VLISEGQKRTFWALFTISVTMTSFFSRSWSAFDLRYIDCAFPLDYHDEIQVSSKSGALARARSRALAALSSISSSLQESAHHSVTMTSFFSRSWSAFDLRYIDCAFPLDYHEECVNPEGPLPSFPLVDRIVDRIAVQAELHSGVRSQRDGSGPRTRSASIILCAVFLP
jgi:hypothetical protein